LLETIDQVSPGSTESLGPAASPGPIMPLSHAMSPGPALSPDLQYPNSDSMDMGPVPTVTAPTSNDPLSAASNATPETMLSPPLDLDIATTDGPGVVIVESASADETNTSLNVLTE